MHGRDEMHVNFCCKDWREGTTRKS